MYITRKIRWVWAEIAYSTNNFGKKHGSRNKFSLQVQLGKGFHCTLYCSRACRDFTRTVPVVQKAAQGPKTKYRTCALWVWLFNHSTKAESAGRLDRGQWPRSTLPGCSVHTAAMQPCPSSSPLSPGRSTQPRAPAAAPRRRALSRAGRAPPPASPRAAASSSARPPCVPAHRTRTVAARQGWREGRDAGGVAQAAYRGGLLLRESARPREARHDESRRGAARLLVAGEHPAASVPWASSRALAVA